MVGGKTRTSERGKSTRIRRNPTSRRVVAQRSKNRRVGTTGIIRYSGGLTEGGGTGQGSGASGGVTGRTIVRGTGCWLKRRGV